MDSEEERGYWRWSKQDFFPEESFQSFSSYKAALSQTCSRFKNRLVSRSDDENERVELRKQSEHEMKRCLTWWDLVWFGFGSVIGAGIFVLTGQEAREQAGPGIVLSYVVYTGFDSIATMAEETKNPSRDIPIGLLGSMSIITVIYCLMALSLTMMQKYTYIDPNAAYSVAFQSVGMKWGKYLVAIGALKGMTTVLLVGALGQARYVTHIARTHMIPPLFALVHPKTGTPINANLLVTIPSALIALFSGLDVLASLLSISTLFIFTMIPLALLVRRYYVREVTPRADLLKLIICILIVVTSSMGTSAYWGMNLKGSWIGYTITVPLWFLGTLGIVFFVPQQRAPKVWGVPLVPWIPCLSIATNIFLMGSLEAEAFVRFGVCTLVMLLYYFLFGLHATFDMAHQHIVPRS